MEISEKDRSTVLSCLMEICQTGERDADRIAAAKLLLEHTADDDRTLTVVMEGAAGEYGG